MPDASGRPAGGAKPRSVALIGPQGSGKSTLFDALIIPDGLAHAKWLVSNGRAVHWVREAFGHLKVIGAIGDGMHYKELSSSAYACYISQA